jgi:hypothetical protein
VIEEDGGQSLASSSQITFPDMQSNNEDMQLERAESSSSDDDFFCRPDPSAWQQHTAFQRDSESSQTSDGLEYLKGIEDPLVGLKSGITSLIWKEKTPAASKVDNPPSLDTTMEMTEEEGERKMIMSAPNRPNLKLNLSLKMDHFEQEDDGLDRVAGVVRLYLSSPPPGAEESMGRQRSTGRAFEANLFKKNHRKRFWGTPVKDDDPWIRPEGTVNAPELVSTVAATVENPQEPIQVKLASPVLEPPTKASPIPFPALMAVESQTCRATKNTSIIISPPLSPVRAQSPLEAKGARLGAEMLLDSMFPPAAMPSRSRSYSSGDGHERRRRKQRERGPPQGFNQQARKSIPAMMSFPSVLPAGRHHRSNDKPGLGGRQNRRGSGGMMAIRRRKELKHSKSSTLVSHQRRKSHSGTLGGWRTPMKKMSRSRSSDALAYPKATNFHLRTPKKPINRSTSLPSLAPTPMIPHITVLHAKSKSFTA